ncbi:MAG: LysM peptidoglycan-binding domain-containing protein [Acetatifactor sp.]|nr:LysM peptidoglycan-binding domain-containing protein [Acetatifactor sp.]
MRKTRTVLLVTDDGQFELSVNPPEISVTQDNKDKTIDLLNVGEINVPGKRGLIRISLATFLPDANSPFYTGTVPERIIQAVKKAKNGQKSVRIIISGSDVNTQFTVSSMNEIYKEGQGDIYISWSFVELRDLNTGQVASFVRRYTDTGLCTRSTKRSVPKVVTVQNGDSLWNLARRYYDDGSRWKDIALANDLYEDAVTPGMRLVIPL